MPKTSKVLDLEVISLSSTTSNSNPKYKSVSTPEDIQKSFCVASSQIKQRMARSSSRQNKLETSKKKQEGKQSPHNNHNKKKSPINGTNGTGKNKRTNESFQTRYNSKATKRRRRTEQISIVDSLHNIKNTTKKTKSKQDKTSKLKLPKIITTGLGNIVGSSSKKEAIEAPEETFWEIEKIVGRRVKNSRVEFQVRWKGCSEDENTWEPLDNLCDSAYREALQFSKEEKVKEQRRLDDELRLGLYGDTILDPKNIANVTSSANVNIVDSTVEKEEEENLERDAEIEIGEEDDDHWEWNSKEQLQFRPLERIDVRSPNAREKITEYRLNGTPFVLIGHVGWANFAARWLKKRNISTEQSSSSSSCSPSVTNEKAKIVMLKNDKTSKSNTDDCDLNECLTLLDLPPEKLDLSDPSLTLHIPSMMEDIGAEDVTVVRRNYNEHSPIHGVIPVSKFLKACWTEPEKQKDVTTSTPTPAKAANNDSPPVISSSSSTTSNNNTSRIYLHQWQFPLSDTAGRKLGRQNVPLDSVLGEDLLCHWLDLPQCIGDNPLQYLFMGREDTLSKLHCDNGGLAITIAPIVGQKECTLVHRLDGMSCLYHLNASLSNPNLNEYPLMANARIWRSIIQPGEILFMPAGTFHECHNKTPCLSYSRFHLDDVNLIPFLRSFYDGDAKEIMHDEILWNACIALMRKVEKIADEAGSGKGRRVTSLEFRTVQTLRKLRNVVKDVTRKTVMRDAIKGESGEGTVQGSHDWFRLVNDLDLCLHEFRYRKYRVKAPKFKAIGAWTTEQQKLLRTGALTKQGEQAVIAYDTQLENAYVTLKNAPSTWKKIDVSDIEIGDLLDIKLCKKSVPCKVLQILDNVKAAYLSYEEYPSIYDEWQFYKNLRSTKGDGADLEESEVKEGTIVLNRWGDMKSEYRGKIQKTTHETMLCVRLLGLGSEVVDRLITTGVVIKKRNDVISDDKNDVKETVTLVEPKENDTNYVVDKPYNSTNVDSEPQMQICVKKDTGNATEVSDNSSVSHSGDNDSPMLTQESRNSADPTSNNNLPRDHVNDVTIPKINYGNKNSNEPGNDSSNLSTPNSRSAKMEMKVEESQHTSDVGPNVCEKEKKII